MSASSKPNGFGARPTDSQQRAEGRSIHRCANGFLLAVSLTDCPEAPHFQRSDGQVRANSCPWADRRDPWLLVSPVAPQGGEHVPNVVFGSAGFAVAFPIFVTHLVGPLLLVVIVFRIGVL